MYRKGNQRTTALLGDRKEYMGYLMKLYGTEKVDDRGDTEGRSRADLADGLDRDTTENT